jgi:hypothetical protein
MDEVNVQLRFDGPDLRAHSMDATILGPALLALGELCEGANQVLNGDRARVRVMVKADIKANCVTVDFNVVQTAWQSVQSLLGSSNVATAKQILEWIGIVGTAAGTGYSLFKFLRWKQDKKESQIQINQGANGNTVVINIEGDNNSVTIPEEVYRLSKNVQVVDSVKTITAPVANEIGIDEVAFLHNSKVALKIGKPEAEEIQKARADSEENPPQFFTAHIVVHAPVLDPKSKNWKFKLNGRIETINIEKTKIAEQSMERGGVNVGDTYKVKIKMVERKTKSGEFKTDFSVEDVLEFYPGTRLKQAPLIVEPEGE